MAVNSKAIGLLFEVAGGGNIDGETGKRINGQLRNLVGAINKSGTLKLKLAIDTEYVKKEVKLVQDQLKTIKPTSGGGSSGRTSNATVDSNKQSAAWKEATARLNDYYKLLTQVQQAMTRTTEITASGTDEDEAWKRTYDAPPDSRWRPLIDQLQAAQTAYDGLLVSEERQSELSSLIISKQNKLTLDMQTFTANGQQAWYNLTAKVHDYINRVEESASRNEKARDKLKDLRKMANGTDWHGYDALKQKLGEVQAYINQNSLATETWFQKMTKTFGTRIRSLLSGLILGKLTTSLRDIRANVEEIDAAMTDLKIVTQESDAILDHYAKTAEQAAQRIGASVSELIKSTTTYARLGFSLNDASILGELTTAYSNVGDVSVDDATRNITGIVKAYQINAEDLEAVLDKLIYVGRNFAISSGEIGEGMNNAASSLAANGNTLNEAMGILTAANTTAQDISRASTATRTIAARLSAATQELEEFGETVDANTIPKLEKAFKAYGIEITNGNGELKSTYQILDSIADKWGELNEEEKSAIRTLAAGTRQQDIFNSIIDNWNDAQRVVEEADGSIGELYDATQTRLDSIQGKLAVLKAKFQTLSNTVLDGGILKFLTDSLSVLTDIITGVSSVINSVGGLNTVLTITAGIVATLKAESIATGISSIATGVKRAGSDIAGAFALIGEFGLKEFGKVILGINKTSLVIGLVVIALTAVIAAITRVTQARKEAINGFLRDAETARAEAKKLATEAEETSDSIKSLTEEYADLAKAKGDGQFEGKQLTRVQEIQASITSLVGDQAANIDLVNGKIEEQIGLLQELQKDSYTQALANANTAVVDAKDAILKANKGDVLTLKYLVKAKEKNDWFEKDAKAAGLELDGRAIKHNFDNVDAFIKQYQNANKLKNKLAAEGKNTTDAYKELSQYLLDFKDVYNSYLSSKAVYEEILAKQKGTTQEAAETAKGITHSAKSLQQILSETQSGFDGIADAMKNVTKEGYLTVDALASLAQLEQDGSLGGLRLKDILGQDEKGFKLAEDALQKYIDALIEQNTLTGTFATEGDKANAISDLENLRRVITTMLATQEASTDASKEQTAALKEELNAYKKLVDLRKTLLQQYKDEVSYKKALSEKEQSVSQLKTQLAVARLDTSAAGQAKARQIASDLQEAQNDLDDYTLEHAIDVVTNELDLQYDEYENNINTRIDEIENAITEQTDKLSFSSDALTKALENLTAALETVKKSAVAATSTSESPVASAGTGAILPTYTLSTSGEVPAISSASRWYSDADAGKEGVFVRTLSEFERGNNADKRKYQTYQNYLDAMYQKYKGVPPTYHSGGIVGGLNRLKSTETFAKLLQGEFVATPKMMAKFVNSTLPAFASGTTTTINSPLVSIQCDHVTQDALPRLQEVVNQAVATIKQQLESGMNRAGHHKTVKQIV